MTARAALMVLALVCGVFAPVVSGPAVVAYATGAGRLVIIGVPGLLWSELSREETPHLWRLATTRGAAAMSTRGAPPGATCPMAGWLTVSAGQRAGPAGSQECGPPPALHRPRSPGVAPGFAEHARWNARRSPYRARTGLLGQAVRDAGGKTLAIGPGALFAAADRSGQVDRYVPEESGAERLGGYRLIVADISAFSVEEADRRAGRLLGLLPPGSDVLLAGVADAGPERRLHVAISSRHAGLLTSPSTKQPGLVTLADLTPTALDALGLEVPPGMGGRAWTSSGEVSPGPVARLTGSERAATALNAVRFEFYVLLTAAQVLFFLLAGLALRKRWAGEDRRRRILSATWVAAVFGGAIPLATFLAGLVPWWSAGSPMPALIGTVVLAAAVVAGAGLAGPWRRRVLGPLTVVSAVTAVALAADVLTGSHLQLDGLAGYSTELGGRFHGFANLGWAAFATGTILALAAVAQPLLDRDRRATAVIMAAVAGAAGAVIIGWPAFGANFGGTISWVAGIVVFLSMLGGLRLTVARVTIACALGVLVIAVIAWLDWLRPRDQRTHVGEFADRVLAGEALVAIGRKVDAVISTTLGNVPLTIAAFAALSFLYLVLRRPPSWRISALQLAYEAAPALRPALFALLTTAIVGFAVNDSGIGIPAMILTMAVPLVAAAALRVGEQSPVSNRR